MMKKLLIILIAFFCTTQLVLAQKKTAKTETFYQLKKQKIQEHQKSLKQKKYKESLNPLLRPDPGFKQRLGAGGINVRGNMTFIGNNNLNREYDFDVYTRNNTLSWFWNSTCSYWYQDYTYTLYTATTANDNYPESVNLYYIGFVTGCGANIYFSLPSINNGQQNMQYVDIDDAEGLTGNGSTDSSSKATLTLPNGCSRIVYAGLYWAGNYPFETWAGREARTADPKDIKFKIPGQDYVDISGELIYDSSDGDSQQPYVYFSDVTTMVQGLTSPDGEYYVGNVRAVRGYDDSGQGIGGSAGWTMVVIYEDSTESSKNISIFDGFVSIDGTNDVDVTYDGFTTIPAGNIKAEFIVGALEGDGGIPGDQFQIFNKSGVYEPISNGTNPSDNFFNGSITDNAVNLTPRTPSSTNTLGFDVDQIQLDNTSNSIIGNGDTSAQIRFTTDGDVYWPFLNAMSIEIIEPIVQLVKTIDDGAGNDIAGTTVNLGDYLWYDISFQNVGTDNSINTQIVDILPKNVDLIEADLVLPTSPNPANPITYTYDPPTSANDFRGRIVLTIPNEMVEENDPSYSIRLRVQVVTDCSRLRDVCSNLVQNQASANYEGETSGIVVTNEGSFSELDACNLGIVGTSNFLADTDGCNFDRTQVICGGDVTLTAGAGFDNYSWVGPGGFTANTQSVTVNSAGDYTVTTTAPAGCVVTTETITVVNFNDEPNPLTSFADRVYDSCASNSFELAEIYLCGDGSSRTINLPFNSASNTTVEWYKLDETSCTDVTATGCANIAVGCTWNEVGNKEMSVDFDTAGEYRLDVLYDGQCPKSYYFNVYKATLNPDIVKEDLYCGNPAEIVINNIPNGYQYSLTGPGGFNAPYQDDNTFTVTQAGDYSLTIRLDDPVAASCVYTFPLINIQEADIDIDVLTSTMYCANENADIRVQVNNVAGPYTYTLTEGGNVIGTQGPIADNDYTFNVTSGGNYVVTVTTPDCTATENISITEPDELTITPVVTKDITCLNGASNGIIDLSSTGGTLTGGDTYTYAVWSGPSIGGTPYTTIADIPNAMYSNNDPNFTSPTTYSIPNGSEGTYTFVVVDSNNCYTISQPVDIVVEAELSFNHTATPLVCSTDTNGIINVNVNGDTLGFSPIEYSIDGGTTWNTTGVFNNLAANTYTVSIRASKSNYQCNYEIPNVVVTAPDPIFGEVELEREFRCTAGAKVRFFNVSGGTITSDYDFGVDSGDGNGVVYYTQSSNVFNSFSPGTYTFYIRDNNGCEYQIPTPIVVEPLDDTPVITPTIEYNCDGTGNVTLSPTKGSYEYSLDGAPSTKDDTFDNLPVGSHTITVDYGKQCSVDVNFEILADQEFRASITGTTDSTCNNADDGTITINAANYGGVSYDYSIDGGANWITTAVNPVTITGLDNTTHDIRVSATVGNLTCPLDLGTVTLTEPTTVTVSASITKEASCAAPTGATIEAVATGGTPPYQYSIDGGTTWQASGVFTDIAASGTAYTIISQDSRNCASTSNATVTVDAPATVTHTATVTQCYDGSNGEIEVTVTSGNGNYQFSLNGGPWQTPTPATGTTYTFTGLTPNTYTIDVRDDFGCTSTQSTHTINPQLTANLIVEDITCNPGEVTINATGGDGNYVYQIVPTGSTFTAVSTSNNLAVLIAGTYDVYVRDNNGNAPYCEYVQTITVTRIDDPTITTTVVQPDCNGNTGDINIIIADGVAPYTAVINSTTTTFTNTQGPINTNNVSFTGLASDTYEIVITDANNCVTATSTETITAPDALTGTASITQAYTCLQQGVITFATPTGGTAPFLYGIDGVFSNDPIKPNLTNGTYALVIRDANNCEFTLPSITINGLPGAPTLNSSVTYNCDGTGNITVTPLVGTYTYSLDGAAAQASNVFNNVAVGSHTITVDYGSSCSLGISVDVAPDQEFTASITGSTDSTCNNADDGTITINAANYGGASYDYSIDGGTNWINTAVNPVTITGLDNIAHDIRVRATVGNLTCPLDLGTVTLTEPTAVTVTASITKEASCAAPTGATIEAVATGGTPPYQYSIDGGTTWQASGVFTDIAASGTAYTIISQDSRNCASTSNATVTVDAPATVTHTATVTQCYDGSNGEIAVTVTSGNGNYQFSLNGGPWQTPTPATGTTYTFTGLTPNTYTVDVSDDFGCTSTQSTHTINPQLSLTTTLVSATCNPGSITINATGGDGNYEYAVVTTGTGVTAGDFSTTNPVTVTAGTWDVYVRDKNGGANYCEATETVVIQQITNPTITTAAIQPNCNGDTGTINVTVADGAAPYTVTVNGTAPVSTTTQGPLNTLNYSFTGLVANTYQISVTDANGCVTAVATETITAPTVLSGGSASATDLECDPAGGTILGTINFSAPTGGTPGYTYFYRLDGDPTFIQVTGTTVTNLPAGLYNTQAEDANGCEITLNDVTIGDLPVAPALTAAVTYNCDGTGNITITPPVGTYTYNLDGTGAQAANVFNDVAIGAHTITVNYGSNCTIDVNVNVEPNNAFNASITASTGNTCNGANDGTITIEAINIAGNFDYSTDNGATWNTTTSNPYTITGLASGNYDVQVRPDNASPVACTLTLATTILDNPTVVSVAAAITKEVSCAAPTGATITATPTGGTAPYRYNINGGAWQTSPVFTGVTASGTAYTINIEDANNCPSSTTVLVSAPLAVTFDVVPEVCYDTTNGELVVTVTQGAGNYQFSLDGGPFQASATNTYTFTGLTNGTYSVTVQDGLGCSTTTVGHTINDQLLATATVTDASCNNGEILVNATGGAGSYVYSLTAANAGVPADGTFNNTNPISTGNGTYDVYVRDNNGTGTYCEFLIEDVVVNLIPDVAITATANQPTCNGDTGSIDVQINAGTGQSPHTIVVTNGLGAVATLNNFVGSSTSFNNLVAETYTITITDALGCSDTETVTLTDPPVLTATIVPVRPVCGTDFVGNETLFGYDFTGVPTVLATQKIQYSIDNGATWQDSPIFRGTAGSPNFNYGTVTFPAIRITDIATSTITYCLYNFGSYTMPFEVSPLVVNVTTNSLDCTTGAEAVVTVTGGVGPYEYTYNTAQTAPGPGGWVPAGGTASNTFTFTGLTPGRTYYFFVKDLGDSECIKVDDTFFIDIDVIITPSILSQSCSGGSTGSVQFDIDDTKSNLLTGGVPPINWELFSLDVTTGLSTSIETGTQGNLDPITPLSNGTLAPGTYYLQIENAGGTCTFASPNIEILETAPINGNLTVVNDITCATDGAIRVDNVTGGTAPYTYSVATSNNFTPANANITGNLIEFSYADVIDPTIVTGVDNITITITDSNGNSCSTTVGPESLAVSQPPIIDSAVPNSCDTNKTITITASSGTAPYQYSTDGGTTYSAPTTNTTYLAEGLTAGSYNVIVQDANGCTSAISAVDIQDTVDFTLTQTKNLDCSVSPEADVVINVTSGSGLANYEYEITGPSATVARTTLPTNPLTFNPSIAGTYTVTIYDTAETPNCQITKTIDIAARVEPNFTATATVNDICDGDATGEITVTTIDNGILPLNYTISPDPATAGTISSTGNVVFTNLPAGNYTIRGTSTVNECFTEQVVEIRDLDPIVPAAPIVTEFACTTGNLPNSATVTIPAGTVGGSGTYTRVVFQYTPVSGAVENQDSASLSFTTTNISGGPVTITVYDDNGCSSAVVNTAITALDVLSNASVTVDNAITCNTGEDITVDYTATLGTAVNITIEGTNGHTYGPFTQNAVTSGDFDGLPTGDYVITIVHPTTGCSIETFHTVGDAPQFDLLIASIKDESCKDANNGKVVLEFNPATPYVGQYDFALYDAATNTVVDITATGLNIPHLGVTAPTDVHNLPSGTYYIIATLNTAPSVGCTAQTANFTISEPEFELDVTAVVDPVVSCATGSDATITATATGGWGSYVYQLELVSAPGVAFMGYDFATNGSNNVFTNIPAGDYRVIVRDKDAQGDLVNIAEAISCRRTEFPVSVIDPTQVSFTLSENDNSCDASSGGSITINALGGTGTYVYSLSVGGTVVATETLTAVTHTFTNLGANTYDVNVVDSNGCPAAATQSVTISPTLDFSLTETKKLDCSGTPAASVSLEVLSGSGTYQYEVVGLASGTLVAQTAMGINPLVFNPTVADTYTVTVFDSGATPVCSIAKTIVIQPELQPDFTAVATTNDICNGDATGVIQLTANDNGILPLSYSISSVPASGAAGATFNAATNTYENLAAGTYTITGTGTNSCPTDRVVTISENNAIDISAAITVAEFGCTTGNATNNATITVDPTNIAGGTGNFIRVVFIDNGTGTVLQDSSSFVYTSTNEAGGNYTINVYDDSGCLGTAVRDIQPFEKLLDAAITVTKAIDCATGEDITVKINPDILNAVYTITGANTGFTATQTVALATDAAVFTNLAPDDYTINITHPITGCVFTTTHVVAAAPTFTLDINNIQNVSCFGDASGSSELIFSTSTPYTGNYTYEIFNVGGVTTGITGNGVGNVSESLTGLVAGNYYVSVTMTDSPFCPVQSSDFTIEGPTAALAINATPSFISCVTNDSGEVVLSASGGWSSYQYQLVNTTTGTTFQTFNANTTITGLTAGQYEATVRDGNNCTVVTNFELLDPIAITAGFNIIPNDCEGEFTASIEMINVAGGQTQVANPNYTYVLVYPNGTRSASQTSNIFSNLEEGTYEVLVSDGYSCQGRIEPIVITDPTKVVATANITADITCDRPEAIVEVSGAGGSGNYMYSVDGTTNFVTSNMFNVTAGPHVFYVRDDLGCISDPYTITVDTYETLVPTLNVISGHVTCNGDANGVLSATAVGGLNNYEYQLLDATSVPYTPIGGLQNSNMFTDLVAGTYAIRVHTTNAAGDVCFADTAAHTVTEPEPIVLAESHTDVNCFGGDDGTITITPSGGNGTTPQDYEYNISTDSPNKFVTNNVFEHLAVGTYIITVKDKVGCIETIEIEIEEPDELTITLVNVVEQTCLNDPTPTITVDVQGGTAPYFISVNNGTPFGPYANSGNITLGAAEGIQGGQSYIISVSDSGAGCSPEPLPLLTTLEPVNLELTVDYSYTCPTGNVILAMVADNYKNSMSYTLYESGTPVITNNTGEFIDVPAGEYTITATHTATSCSENSTSAPITIVDYDPITFTVDTSIKNQLHVNAVGGNEDYMYSFDGGATWTDQNWTWIYETRDYQIIVKDSREETGCPVEQTIEGVYITIKVPNLFSPDGDNDADHWYPLEVEDYHNLRVFIYDRYARKIVNFKGVQQGWDGTYEGKPLPSGDYWYTIYYNELSGEEKKIMGHFTLYR